MDRDVNMQISRFERDDFDRLIRWALKTSYANVQPPDRVWQRIVRQVSNLDRASSGPGYRKDKHLAWGMG